MARYRVTKMIQTETFVEADSAILALRLSLGVEPDNMWTTRQFAEREVINVEYVSEDDERD